MRYGDFSKRTALFILADVLPEHVQKTFQLDEKGNIRGKGQNQFVVKHGEQMPERLDAAVILYAADDWHMGRAAELNDQLEQLFPGILTMGLAIYQGG